jgi:hypothetical protein
LCLFLDGYIEQNPLKIGLIDYEYSAKSMLQHQKYDKLFKDSYLMDHDVIECEISEAEILNFTKKNLCLKKRVILMYQ